ncbi:hypothetical protein LNQ03_03335 [Klebsiella pneumoniae subsp. pneumoniae]|nr:hypothetical protein [Klebsiella pneumoniae subsp. pneumoniae]
MPAPLMQSPQSGPKSACCLSGQYEGYRRAEAPGAGRDEMVTSGEHHGTLQSFRTLSETAMMVMQPETSAFGAA